MKKSREAGCIHTHAPSLSHHLVVTTGAFAEHGLKYGLQTMYLVVCGLEPLCGQGFTWYLYNMKCENNNR